MKIKVKQHGFNDRHGLGTHGKLEAGWDWMVWGDVILAQSPNDSANYNLCDYY
jgi:hypothetical protein